MYDAHVVVIFNECHRSQFGDMHAEITCVFKRYHLFGFTGTPIFAENADSAGDPSQRTTQQAFGGKLHTYTLVDAINDKQVPATGTEYQGKIAELQALFPLRRAITGEAVQKAFIKLFGATLRLKKILTAFDDFAVEEILGQQLVDAVSTKGKMNAQW